jgi:TolB-like protein/Flp pilus assembly protein TadD
VAEGDGGGLATGANTRTPDVFISYASQDAPLANTVVAALEREGLKCWIAPRDVTPGEFYADAIVRAINEAIILVLILTENAITSPHVLREVERTSAKRHSIVSFRIGAVTLPPALEYFLSASHWLDATTSGVDSAMPKLVEAVKRLVAPSSGVDPGCTSDIAKRTADLLPHPPSTKSGPRLSGPVIALSAVIALGLAYFAADRLWFSKHATGERHFAVEAPAAAPLAPAISEKSVAVLPFVDMSEKKDQEYFSDGLSEELIDMLTKIPDLQVPARTSSFYFKGKQTTVEDIAKALNVSHVLEGSVRKSGNKLRVTAQLIRVDNGYHLWSESYDREMSDVFKVQDDIAAAVVKALKVSLLQAPRAVSTANSEAYTLYLQARLIWRRGTRESDLKAIEYLQQALRIDPRFAPGWATLAHYYVSHFANYTDEQYQTVRPRVLAAAERAIALEPQISEAHLAKASMLFNMDWDWNAANNEVTTALQLDPRSVDALRLAASIADVRGRHDEALELMLRALSIDPVNANAYAHLAWEQQNLDRNGEAESNFRKALELNPTGDGLHYGLALLAIKRGNAQTALDELEHEPEEAFRLTGRAIAYDALGRSADANRALAELERKYADMAFYGFLMIYASRNDLDQAFYWLDRGYEKRDDGLPLAPMDYFLRNLHGDPRWQKFLRKMNLSE